MDIDHILEESLRRANDRSADDNLKLHEEQKREAAWDPVERWRAFKMPSPGPSLRQQSAAIRPPDVSN